MSAKTDAVLGELRAFGLAYPGAHSKAPWPEHDDLAVRDKTFAYLPVAGQSFSLSVKLPYTSEVALDLPYARPTAYGLGKSGWVSFTPSEAEMPALEQLKEWIDESYRAQAPRKLVKELDGRG
jgi:predicted DNA-binding protein (MmcQ/YjbR family)